MPIKPENRKHYTKAAGWPEIRAAVLKRASGDKYSGIARCELCAAPNGCPIVRAEDVPSHWRLDGDDQNAVIVVLTIAHLNQDPTDNRMVNLLALCQRCHNKIDAPWRQQHAKATREARKASNATQP